MPKFNVKVTGCVEAQFAIEADNSDHAKLAAEQLYDRAVSITHYEMDTDRGEPIPRALTNHIGRALGMITVNLLDHTTDIDEIEIDGCPTLNPPPPPAPTVAGSTAVH